VFSHVMIGTNDIEKARVFYDTVLGTLAVAPHGLTRRVAKEAGHEG
jgi:catechol 2,3-dioxygenase-like lactoylglutathione lyase family enzyme